MLPPQGSDDPTHKLKKITITSSRPKSCPFYKQVGRNDQYFLSKCTCLPPEDRLYFTRARSTYITNEDEPDITEFTLPVEDKVDPPAHAFAWIVSRRVSTKYSHDTSKPFTIYDVVALGQQHHILWVQIFFDIFCPSQQQWNLHYIL